MKKAKRDSGAAVAGDPAMEAVRTCANILQEKKGEDILILDLRRINNYFDYFIIATGNSLIHCRSMAREMLKRFRTGQHGNRRKPEMETGWIIMDYDEIVIHIFTGEKREYYQLEKLWADADKIDF